MIALYLRSVDMTDRQVWRTLRRELFMARHPRVVRARRKLARKVRSLRPGSAS